MIIATHVVTTMIPAVTLPNGGDIAVGTRVQIGDIRTFRTHRVLIDGRPALYLPSHQVVSHMERLDGRDEDGEYRCCGLTTCGCGDPHA